MNRNVRGRGGFGLRALLLAGTALFAAPSAQAQMWEPTGGPGQGGLVRGAALPASGDRWAAVYGAGVFKSTDGGNTWVPNNGTAPNALNHRRVYTMVVNAGATPYRGYVGTLLGGVYKTDDGGANWGKANTGLGCTYVRALAVTFGASSGADTVLAGTGCRANSGIYRSVDGGATWTATNGIVSPDVTVNSISIVNPGSPIPNLRFAATSDGIYKSTDLGVTWTLSNGTGANVISGPNGPNAYHVGSTYDATNGLSLVAAVEGGGLFRSTDQGANWTNVLAKPPAAGIGTDFDKNFYAAIDGEGVYRSSDRGASWTLFASNAALPAARNVTRIGPVANSPNFVAQTMAGMYRSSDSGATWVKSSAGLPGGYSINAQADFRNTSGDVYAAAADGVHICAAALSPTNSDCTWTKVGDAKLGHMGSGGHVLITSAGIYTTTSNLGVFKLDETNKVWVAMNNGLPIMVGQGGQLRGDPNNPNGLWLGLSDHGVYYSADAGANWVAKNGSAPNGLAGAARGVRHMATTPSMVLISTDGGMYKSTDSGATWNKLPLPAMSTTATPYALPADHISVDGATGYIYAAVFQTDALGVAYPHSGVWKSADGGATWTQSLAGRRVHEIRVARNGSSMTLYAGIWEAAPNGGAWQSTDDGATWTQNTSGLTNNLISSFAVFNGVLEAVATNGGGVFGFNSTGGSPNPSGANYDQIFIGRNKNLPDGGENFGVSVRYPRQANDNLKSAVLACPGATSTSYTFSSNSTGHEWFNGASYSSEPVTPLNCTSTVTYIDNTVNSQTVTVDRFSPADYYVTNVSLQPNANLTTAPSVTWSPPSAAPPSSGFVYQSNIFTANFSAQAWYVGPITSTQAAYSGPGLTPGAQYRLGVTTIEGTGTNVMHAAQTWIPFCYQCGTTTGSTSTMNFLSGWNLAGNGSSGAIDVATAFGDTAKVTSVWKWVSATSKWAFYTPTQSDGGASYATGKGYDSLASVGAGEGFWVNAGAAFTAPLPAGTAVSSGSFQSMPSGWNLIAIGDDKTPSGFNTALSTTPPSPGSTPLNLTTLWAWDATKSNWYFYAPSLEAKGGTSLTDYITSKSYLDFGTGTLGPTTGFWVNKP